MIDGRISPLRQRMIEDMNVRHFAANTQETYIRAVEKLARFLDRSPATATLEDLRRFQLHLTGNPRHAGDDQRNDGRAAVLLHRDARSARRGAAPDLRPRAAQIAGRAEPGGGHAPPGGGDERQVQGGAQRRLRRRPARFRNHLVESVGHRQQAHVVARRAWQGRQDTSCDALASIAGAAARLVADRTATSLAFPWARPDQADDEACSSASSAMRPRARPE